MHDAVRQAREEFESVSDELAVATSELYLRCDFLELDDERAMDEGDFVGRLLTLFGPADADKWVLRHRETGIVVTAYTGEDGPSFGGGQGIDPDRWPREAAMFVERMLQNSQVKNARVQSDPELVAGPPSQRPENAHLQYQELLALDHPWHRRFADANAPGGVREVIARLSELLESVPPADWEALRYDGAAGRVYRVGARDGEGFGGELGPTEAMAALLDYADREDRSMLDYSDREHRSMVDTAGCPFYDPDLRAIDTWIRMRFPMPYGVKFDDDDDDFEDLDDELEHVHDDELEDDNDEFEYGDDRDAQRAANLQALAAVLPRVQQAWLRSVARLSTYSADVAAELAYVARIQSEKLQLDPATAEAAIRAGLKG